jgi:hypothetical protein
MKRHKKKQSLAEARRRLEDEVKEKTLHGARDRFNKREVSESPAGFKTGYSKMVAHAPGAQTAESGAPGDIWRSVEVPCNGFPGGMSPLARTKTQVPGGFAVTTGTSCQLQQTAEAICSQRDQLGILMLNDGFFKVKG